MVKREKELHLQILAFSVSHDHRTVRIYGHYPLIDGDKTEFYRHPIHDISFALGKEKRAAYMFTENVYDIWMPTQLERIRSAIDALSPSLEQSEPGESGLSQGLESHNRADQSSDDAASLLEEGGSSHSDSPNVTPDTSLSQRAFKMPKKRVGNHVSEWLNWSQVNLTQGVLRKLYGTIKPSKQVTCRDRPCRSVVVLFLMSSNSVLLSL